jgi:sRNA-binding protein
MASQYGVERTRGTKEAARQLAVLRGKWPIAFPVKSDEVRPLTVGAVGEIAAAMGWSVPYTLGVLAPWKMAPVYCRAVLAHDHRIALDGAPAEPVDAKAKESATKRLAHLAARHAAKQASASAKAKPKPAAPADAPTLRDQVRAGLLRRRA